MLLAVVGAGPHAGLSDDGVAARAGKYRSHFTQRYPPDRLRQIPTRWYWASPGHNDQVAEISQGTPGTVRVPCVGAVITDESGRLLLIQRGHDPGRGLWSIPGGRIEAGESDAEAVIREVAEETGLTVTCGPLLGAVERPGLAGAIADIRDYRAFVSGGELRPGDDADAARWVTTAEADELEAAGQLTGDLLATLRSWSFLL